MSALRPRLKTAADTVKGGVPVIDVGTDHAYLPVYLVENGIVPYAVASDIGIMPLANAEKTVAASKVKDRIRLFVSDGLKSVDIPYESNISVCGMGGILISEILTEASDRISHAGIRLILQPMTHACDVRRWLCENGFSIIREECVRESGRYYCCIGAEYTGKRIEYELGYLYFGTIKGETTEEKEYIKTQIKRIKKRFDALSARENESDECADLQKVISYYESRYGYDR